MRVREVPLSRDSLNEGDCFILDAGLQIFQWNGNKSGPFERTKASNIVIELKSQRGKARSIVMGTRILAPNIFFEIFRTGEDDREMRMTARLYGISLHDLSFLFSSFLFLSFLLEIWYFSD